MCAEGNNTSSYSTVNSVQDLFLFQDCRMSETSIFSKTTLHEKVVLQNLEVSDILSAPSACLGYATSKPCIMKAYKVT